VSVIFSILITVNLPVYAVDFKDHVGYIPSWATQIGQNQALSTCIHVDYSTQDGRWCSEFDGYVLDHLNDNYQNTNNSTSSSQNTSQNIQTPQFKDKMFGSSSVVISKDAYVNKLYDLNIVPPKDWKTIENVKLLDGSVGLVGFYANGYYTDYAPNFIINYKDLGTLNGLTSMNDDEILNTITQGILNGMPDSQAKILNKNIESFSDGYRITVDLVWTQEIDNNFIPLEKEVVFFIFDSGKQYTLVFVAKPVDFDIFVNEFRRSLATLHIGSISTITGMTGTYTDSQNGFKIDLPDGWYYVKSKSINDTIIVFPSNYDYNTLSEGIMVSVKKNGQNPSSTSSDTTCKSLWIQYLMLNSAQARKQVTQCSDKKFESYSIATGNGNLINVNYMENISKYDQNLGDFEKFAWSIKVDHPGPTKDTIRHQAGYMTTTVNIPMENKLIPVRFDSSSNITSTTLIQEDNHLAIKLDQVDKNGSLIFPISKILSPPYSATLDGKNILYDTIDDKIENVIEFSTDYSKGKHILVIQGSSTALQTNTTSAVPSWIKNNAKWWHDGSISDEDFEKDVKYLIDNKIIKTSQKTQSDTGSKSIPKWVKNNAGMCSDGNLSEDDFLKGIEYLVKIGIIKV
jgi:hypothetical protein